MVVMFPKPVQWIINREWQSQTAFIVGGGPSVKQQNLELLRDKNVIAINSSYLAVPWSQFLFFGDARWYNEERRKRAATIDAYAGRIVTCSAVVRGPRLLGLWRVNPPPGFAEQPTHVASQRTNLQGAMNMAAHLGCNRLVLLGADMGRAPDGVSHHHDPHPWPNAPGNADWDLQMQQLRLIAEPLQKREIEVINTSAMSRIDWWPKQTLEQAIGA
jgi:hypothetical protein